MKKKIFFSLLLFSLLSLFVFRQPLFLALAKWQLSSYTQKNLNGRFSYNQLSLENGNVIISDASFFTRIHDTLNSLTLKTKKITVTYSVDLSDWSLGTDISFQEPHLLFTKRESSPLSLDTLLENLSSLLSHLPTKLNISDGIIELEDHSGANFPSQKYSFRYDKLVHHTQQVALQLQKYNAPQEENLVQLALERKNEDLRVSLRAKDLHCQDLTAALNILSSHASQDLDIQKGLIQAQLQLDFPSFSQTPGINGTLAIEDCVFTHEPTSLSGQFQSLHAQFEKKEPLISTQLRPTWLPQTFESLLSNTHSHFELSKDASLKHLDGNQLDWELRDLSASLSGQERRSIKLLLHGLLHREKQFVPIIMEGRSDLDEEGIRHLNMSLNLLSDSNKDIALILQSKPLQLSQQTSKIHLINFGPEEIAMLQGLLKNSAPQVSLFSLSKGTLNSSFELSFVDFIPERLSIKDFLLQDTDISFPSLVRSQFASIKGSGSLNLLQSNPFSSLEGEFFLSRGSLRCLNEDTPWHFPELQATLRFTRGMLHNSCIKSSSGELSGEVNLNWFSQDQIMNCHLQGRSKAFSKFLSTHGKKWLNRILPEDHMEILAQVKRMAGGLTVDGTIGIDSPSQKEKESITFGLNLEKTSSDLWNIWPMQESDSGRWLNCSNQFMQAFTPPLIKPAIHGMTHWLSQELGFNGIVLADGFFEAHSLDLNKYLSPLIFPDQALCLQGNAHVQGTFNQHRVNLYYTPTHVSLENPRLLIEMESSETSELSLDTSSPKQAFHSIDLNSFTHFGVLPVKNASFLDKTFGSTFTDISANVHFSEDQIHVSKLQTKADHVKFSANIDIDYRNSDAIEVTILPNKASGKVVDVQRFISHFVQSSATELPISGNVFSSGDMGNLHFLIAPQGLTFNSRIKAQLLQASYGFPHADIYLNNISSEIEYYHKNNELIFHSFEADYFTQDSKESRPLKLSSRKLRLYNFPQTQVSFDLHLLQDTEELARLVGEASPLDEQEALNSLEFDNSLCHIGQIVPNFSKVWIKNWETLQTLEAQPSISLNSFLKDAKDLLPAKFLPLTEKQVNEYGQAQLSGTVHAKLFFESAQNSTTFTASGKDLSFHKQHVNEFFITGEKTGPSWNIDRLEIDQLTLSVNALQKERDWDIRFLGLKYGKSLVMSLEGNYFADQEALQAQVHLLEAHLPFLDELEPTRAFSQKWNPQGSIRSTGSANISKEEGQWLFTTHLNASFRNLALQNIAFTNKDNVPCFYSSKDGLVIEDVAIELNDNPEQNTTFHAKKIIYQPETESLVCEIPSFSLFPSSISTLSTFVETLFPNNPSSSSSLLSSLQKSAATAPLTGRVSLHSSPDSLHFDLSLSDGDYLLNGVKHKLSNFHLNRSPQELLIRTQYHYEDRLYHLTCKADPTNINQGTLNILESPKQETPLVLNWKNNEQGFSITKVEGQFSGQNLLLLENLHSKSDDTINLQGRIDLDLAKLSPLLSPPLQRQIHSLQISRGFSLDGSFSFPRNRPADFSFQGNTAAEDFTFFTQMFKKLDSELSFYKDSLTFKNLTLEDPALSLSCKQISLTKKSDEDWCVEVPLIEAHSIKPRLFQDPRKRRNESKTLVIKHAELHNFSGSFSDPGSFTATGSLYFHNPAKKNLFNILFAIPNDIIARIGLDLNLLTPVMGHVDYALAGNKIYLTNLADVYSDGRRSKFYLSEESTPSYVDLAGNMDVKINMKQYNIIFKIAELFTISIKGTLDKPLYTLQKQANQKELELDPKMPNDTSDIAHIEEADESEENISERELLAPK